MLFTEPRFLIFFLITFIGFWSISSNRAGKTWLLFDVERGLESSFAVESAGTHAFDGQLPHPLSIMVAEQHGIADRTNFSGPVEGVRKWALIAGADLMVTPSINENFGIVVIEALGVGTPVICTPDVGAGEIVAEIDPSCVVARDADTLAAAIHALLEDPERRGRIGEQGRKMIAVT